MFFDTKMFGILLRKPWTGNSENLEMVFPEKRCTNKVFIMTDFSKTYLGNCTKFHYNTH